MNTRRSNHPSSRRSRAPAPRTSSPIDAAKLRDQRARTERTFVGERHTNDDFAEMLGEGALRSITSGQDDPIEDDDTSVVDAMHVVDES